MDYYNEPLRNDVYSLFPGLVLIVIIFMAMFVVAFMTEYKTTSKPSKKKMYFSIFKCFDVTAWFSNLFCNWDFDIAPSIEHYHEEDLFKMGRAADRHLKIIREKFKPFENSKEKVIRLSVILHPKTRARIAARVTLNADHKTHKVKSILFLEDKVQYLYEYSLKDRIKNNRQIASALGGSFLMLVQDQYNDTGKKCDGVRWSLPETKLTPQDAA